MILFTSKFNNFNHKNRLLQSKQYPHQCMLLVNNKLKLKYFIFWYTWKLKITKHLPANKDFKKLHTERKAAATNKKSYAIFSQSFLSVQGLQNKSNDKSFSDFHCNRIINYTFFDADKFKDRCESDWMSNYDTNFIPFHSDLLSSEHITSTAIHRLAYPQRRGSLTVRQGLAVE